MVRDTFSQIVRVGLIILGVAVVLCYMEYAWFAPGRVPPCDPARLPKGHICLETALKDWGDRIVWVDARSKRSAEHERDLGYMLHALGRSFPIRKDAEFEELKAAAMPRLHQAGFQGECIIVFCGQDCTSSQEIADDLAQYGLAAPVFVLEGGWDAIKRDGRLLK